MEKCTKYVRDREGLLLTDTTWRNDHQSILTTRMRTQEITNADNFTNLSLMYAFSLEMWFGVTFDFKMCFLHKFSWKRLETLREKVPDIPFHILLRGANAMGYTNYPVNVVHKLCKQTSKYSVDVFRVFDSLN